ncbi:MAG: beta-galactosidase [Candidatus Omnitrophica bacterium]|nr:beta-galactosidase [Candidatus Omnitrophota bacterium]
MEDGKIIIIKEEGKMRKTYEAGFKGKVVLWHKYKYVIYISAILIFINISSAIANERYNPLTSSQQHLQVKTLQSASMQIHYGIDVNIHDRNIGVRHIIQAFALIRGTGARYVRVGAGGWKQAEPKRGVFDFRSVDRLIRAARSQGLKVLLEIGGNTPDWDLPAGADVRHQYGWVTYAPADATGATSLDGRVHGETDCAAFGEYVRRLTANVAPLGVKYLIIWNEPQNFPKEWIPSNHETIDQNAAAYARLIHQAYINAHSVAPNIHILNGGTEILPVGLLHIMVHYRHNIRLARASLRFTRDLYNNPMFCRSIDVLDVHVGNHGPLWSRQIVDESEHALMKHNGGRWIPVWVTESGYSSMRSVQTYKFKSGLKPEFEVELGPGYDQGDRSQSKFLTNTYDSLIADKNVIGINWTFIVDPPYSGNPMQDGAGLGLVAENLRTHKPAYFALKSIIKR